MTEEIEIFPRVYDVETVQKIFGLGRNCIYQFLEKDKKKDGVVFFEGKSWFHRTKILQDDGLVK